MLPGLFFACYDEIKSHELRLMTCVSDQEAIVGDLEQ